MEPCISAIAILCKDISLHNGLSLGSNLKTVFKPLMRMKSTKNNGEKGNTVRLIRLLPQLFSNMSLTGKQVLMGQVDGN